MSEGACFIFEVITKVEPSALSTIAFEILKALEANPVMETTSPGLTSLPFAFV